MLVGRLKSSRNLKKKNAFSQSHPYKKVNNRQINNYISFDFVSSFNVRKKKLFIAGHLPRNILIKVTFRQRLLTYRRWITLVAQLAASSYKLALISKL